MAIPGSQKVVLLTGATDGLGKAAAILLAEHGYHVFGAGRSAVKREELDALARERKLPLESLEMDVCDDESVRRAGEPFYAKPGEHDGLSTTAATSSGAH